METKTDIRKRIIKQRSLLSDQKQSTKSRKIQEAVMNLDAYKKIDNILLYMDYHNEVQTDLLLQACFEQGKKVGIPKVYGDTMEFYELKNPDDVVYGYCNIREPVSSKVFAPKQALVIVPGVAFSKQRTRIGYGKGFYDQYLSTHPEYLTCGIAYDCQLIDKLPVQEHDVPLHILLTETLMISDRYIIKTDNTRRSDQYDIINTDR